MRNAAAALLALCLGWTPFAGAADLDKPLILVAKPELQDKLYSSTVLVVTPIGGGQHAGFIVNRPTGATLGKKIQDPIYLGGPINSEVIFALVQRPDNPGGDSFEVMPGLYAAADGEVVDRLIDSGRAGTRFVAGLVAWREGELKDEIRKGAWYVLEPDAGLLTRRADVLWEELMRRAVRAENTI
jgi:putative AlgH/UPF0301 family transcriptional regulator